MVSSAAAGILQTYAQASAINSCKEKNIRVPPVARVVTGRRGRWPPRSTLGPVGTEVFRVGGRGASRTCPLTSGIGADDAFMSAVRPVNRMTNSGSVIDPSREILK